MANSKIKLDSIIGLLVILLFISISFFKISFFTDIDSCLYDLGSSFMKTGDKNINNIVIINVDPVRIGFSGKWLSPRALLAETINLLNEKGAKVIGLAIPVNGRIVNEGLSELKSLSEKIQTYPTAKKAPDFRDWILDNLSGIQKKIDVDTYFLDAIKKNNNLIIPVLSDSDVSNSNPEKDLISNISPKHFLNDTNISPSFQESISIDRLVYPYPELLKSISGFGYLIPKDNSYPGNISHSAYLSYNGSLIPSFPLRMAIAMLGQRPDKVKVFQDKIIIKNKTIPLISGRLFIPSGKSFNFREFSLADLIQNKTTLPSLKDKTVIVGLGNTKNVFSAAFTGNRLIADQLISFYRGIGVARPFYMKYIESILLAVFIFILMAWFSNRSRLICSLITFLMLLLIMGSLILCFSGFGIWFRATYLISGILISYLYLVIKQSFSTGQLKDEPDDATRLLGLDFQSRGELDLAYDKFKRLPLDNETKDLMYKLGLEYEKKKMISRAIEVFTHINGDGGFRDLDDRIPRLRASEDSSTVDANKGSDDSNLLTDSGSISRTMVGRYEVLDELGKGSMGLVYKAQDPKINRLVAIKTIRFSDEFDDDVVNEIKKRFFMEAEIAGKLSHPSIVTIHDVGEDGDLTYMAMEYLEGEDLEKYIKKENLLPVRKVLDVVGDIADALDFAHKEGVIHRDIKPANVMLLKNGHIKVTDFGIAKAISSSKTKTGVILGTPNYMSPEQIMGQKIDSKSDIFSLGVLFYQLLTGELPFHGDSLSGLLYQITQVKHSSPRSYNRKVPKVCEQILDKALMKNPVKRFKTAGDMALIIRALGKRIDQLRAQKTAGD